MQIRRGDLVLPLIGAANRDPERYEDADELRLDRQVGMPLSFGSGPHVCIGATLTLMEVEATIAALLRRWPNLQIAEEQDDWIASPLYRGFVSLPLWPKGIVQRPVAHAAGSSSGNHFDCRSDLLTVIDDHA
jgi:cytochrome P450